MNPTLESLLKQVVTALQAGDSSTLAKHTAPWVDAEEFVGRLAQHKSEVLSQFSYTTPAQVQETVPDDGETSFDELASHTSFPSEVTPENFAHWAYIQLLFEEDSDGLEAAVDL